MGISHDIVLLSLEGALASQVPRCCHFLGSLSILGGIVIV
jgi:hypothetical protein